MKTKTLTAIVAMSCFYLCNFAQSPDWAAIKANYHPFVAIPGQYGTPYIQPLNVSGWEDGLQISRDGLHLYAFYTPVDLESYVRYATNNPDTCLSLFRNYLRGPLFGMDTNCTLAPCLPWIHSDIIYASRPNLQTPFTNWTLSNLATPCTWEGAPNFIMKNQDTIDIFLFSRDNDPVSGTKDDIMIMRNVTHNPVDASTLMPFPVNDSNINDNPCIIRLSADTLVLMQGIDGNDMNWSMSFDNGTTWSVPQTVSTVWSGGNLHPHLWNDGTDWWLYFADSITTPAAGIYRAKKQTIDNSNWDDWGPKELVIGIGGIDSGYGQVIAIGEPTLTQWGDISFVILYGDTNSTDPTDVFDCDPWFLPRNGSPLSGNNNYIKTPSLTVYPNPTSKGIIISFSNPDNENYTLFVYNVTGQLVSNKRINTNKINLNTQNWEEGMYFIQLQNNTGQYTTKKIIVR